MWLLNSTLAVLPVLFLMLPAIPGCERGATKRVSNDPRHFLSDPEGLRELLTRNPAAVNGLPGTEIPPIHEAIKPPDVPDSVEYLKVLLEFKPNLEVTEKYTRGETPLYRACATGNTQAVELLIKAGANVNAVTQDGNRPLYVAVLAGRTEIVKLLVDAGVEVNFTRPRGSSLAELAHDHPEIEAMLLKAGMPPRK